MCQHYTQNGDIVPLTEGKTNTLSITWQQMRSKINKASVIVGICVTKHRDNYSHKHTGKKQYWNFSLYFEPESFLVCCIFIWAAGGGFITTARLWRWRTGRRLPFEACCSSTDILQHTYTHSVISRLLNLPVSSSAVFLLR